MQISMVPKVAGGLTRGDLAVTCATRPSNVLVARSGGTWKSDSRAMQLDHHRLRIAVAKLTQLKPSLEEKAVACFEFVRSLPFKHCFEPSAATASGVLRSGCGDSHTKGLLFVAMMRSIGAPARLRMLILQPDHHLGFLGLTPTGNAHSIAEVILDGKWLRVDAYCFDPALGLAARARLLSERRRMGYGTHMNGQVVWAGKEDAFGHFSVADPCSLPLADLGVYDSLTDCQGIAASWNRSLIGRARRLVTTALLNQQIQSLRNSLAPRERQRS